MGKLSEVKLQKYMVLLMGPPLGGKTVFASQFPQPFFIDLEDGLHSVKAMRRDQGLDFDFDVITINEQATDDSDFISLCGKTFSTASGWVKVKKLCEVLVRKMPQDSTLILDNLSRGYEMLISHVQKTTNRAKLQIQDWGTFVDEVADLVNMLKYRAKCNVILIGHEQYDKDEGTGEILRSFLMPTRAKHRIPSIATELSRIYAVPKGPKNKRTVVRILQTSPDFLTAVGSRSLIPDIEDPTYAKVKPYLEAALGRELPPPTWTPTTNN